ncbi:MAG: hypothetical protein WB586_11010 [Chthoniobacterales bacterium]
MGWPVSNTEQPKEVVRAFGQNSLGTVLDHRGSKLVEEPVSHFIIAIEYLGLNRKSKPETVIASEEYGRQICPGRLVVQPRAHQRHWLDDPKAIFEAPTKKA